MSRPLYRVVSAFFIFFWIFLISCLQSILSPPGPSMALSNPENRIFPTLCTTCELLVKHCVKNPAFFLSGIEFPINWLAICLNHQHVSEFTVSKVLWQVLCSFWGGGWWVRRTIRIENTSRTSRFCICVPRWAQKRPNNRHWRKGFHWGVWEVLRQKDR